MAAGHCVTPHVHRTWRFKTLDLTLDRNLNLALDLGRSLAQCEDEED